MRPDPAVLARRLERSEASTQVAIARHLATLHPGYGSHVVDVGGGHLVLNGRHLFVNRLLAGFFDRAPTRVDLAVIRRASVAAGLQPEVEVTPASHRRTAKDLAARGYTPSMTVHVVWQPLDGPARPEPRPSGRDIVVAPTTPGELELWQEVSARGWGHDAPDRRAASDAFAAAWQIVAPGGFLLARDPDDARPLGCAVLTVDDGVATLGGMTTLPAERGRGVQAALIAERLRIARETGCDIATSTTRPDSPSERNLLRHGFRRAYDKHVLVAPGRSD